jgi:hypothetical protein
VEKVGPKLQSINIGPMAPYEKFLFPPPKNKGKFRGGREITMKKLRETSPEPHVLGFRLDFLSPHIYKGIDKEVI